MPIYSAVDSPPIESAKIAGPHATHQTFWGIQYLRGAAALIVVFHHAVDFLPSFAGIRVGATGVDIFFVISGFIMAYTCSRNADPVERKTCTAVHFLLRRGARIIPMYWIATAIAWHVDLLHGALSLDMLKDFLFIPRVYSEEVSYLWPKLVPGWTINCEMFFYVLLGIALILSEHPLRMVVAAVCLLSTMGFVFHPTSAAAQFYSSSIFLEFAFGILVYFAHRHWPKQQPLITRCAVAAAAIGAMIYAAWTGAFEMSSLRFLEIGIPAAFIVWVAVQSFRTTYLPVLAVLGNASYSIYLLHFTVGFDVSLRLIKALELAPTTAASTIAMLSIFLVISTAVGVITYWSLERPMTAHLNQWAAMKRVRCS